MIQFSARLLELLNQPVINTFFCVKLKTLLLTSYVTNLTLADGIYTTTDLISNVDSPKMTSSVDRDLYKITLVDSHRLLLGEFETGLNGAPVSVRLGFVDYYTNLPELSEMFTTYKGIVESYEYVVDTNEVGSITATITCSNPMASLDDSNPYYTSKMAISQIDPNNPSFDQIHEGSGAVMLKWGKK